MRRYLISTFLFALPLTAHAQNYIPSNGYDGAGVVVNMDVLNTPAGSNSYSPPVMSRDLPPPVMYQPRAMTAPVVLRPPVLRPVASPAPIVNSYSPPPAPMPPSIISEPAPAPVSQKRQALGSMHDTPTEEVASLPSPAPKMAAPAPADEMAPVMPPALPSPIMGNTSPIQGQPQVQPATQLAPIKTADNFEAYRLFFDPSSDVLKPSETAVLDKIIGKLSADPSLRLQVRAYANGTPDNAGAARRLSLTRVLKVRDYLMQKNVASTRLDIRALGSGSAEMGDQAGSGNAPPDRVDVIFSK
jgi:outer membrane protein OmpA-like peptidoglycan-associated protein